MKTIKLILLIFAITALLNPPLIANAQEKDFACPYDTFEECQEWALGQVGETSGYGEPGPVSEELIAQRVGQIISLVLGFLGVIFLFLIVYSGVQWMTGGGNDERITKAKKRMIQAVIGLAITVSAFVLTNFIIDRLQPNITNNINEEEPI